MAKHQVTLKLPREFVELCQRDKVSPEHVLTGFIADLCHLNGPSPYCTRGSDERMYAEQYYDRCGYEWMAENAD